MKYESVAVINGRVVGRLGESAGKYVLRYDDAWRHAEGAFPLSLSLPLTRGEHGDEVVRPYLANLLPDNDATLRAWAREYQVSANNPLALLAHVGEECPGALQLLPAERVDEALSPRHADVVGWLSEDEIGARLRRVLEEPGAWREPGDPGQFSLAGMQPKIALLHDGERWGVPSGRMPTTHILKPPALERFPGFAENEHACLQLAARIGLPAARSEVRRFGGEVAIVVERYDRVLSKGGWLRLHQEDFCQALGVHPREKYENDGGPTAQQVIALLAERSREPELDVATLVGALALNWVIAGTDAHAKNYSLLMHPGGMIRLAPLYDVVSLLPYKESHAPSVKLAMSIGGQYRMRFIERRHWERLADGIGADRPALLELVEDVVNRTPGALREVCQEARDAGVTHPVLGRFEEGLATRVTECGTALART
ncbi:MAG TPA: type II toxin-antitoxin system HipA family toxin [Longimicrobiaceae bacterium]|nr:type II toxin-antitoxin system HipA family toxin [Longimicrobiaceae bacterium]